MADQLIHVESDASDKAIASVVADYDNTWMKDSDLSTIGWQKPYPLYIPEQSSDSERIAVFYGDDAGDSGVYQPRISAVLTTDLLVEEVSFRCSDSLQWVSETLDNARSNIAATSVGNLAIFAGGKDDNGYSDVVDIYNADTGEWTRGNWLSEARSYFTATSVGNLAIFAGGYGDNGYSNVVDIYNAISG